MAVQKHGLYNYFTTSIGLIMEFLDMQHLFFGFYDEYSHVVLQASQQYQ